MKSNLNSRKRKSTRIPGFDYSQPGSYFMTICTKNRECLFGHIEDDKMFLNEAGKAVDMFWLEIPTHYPNVILHEHIVMPNHVHGIIELTKEFGLESQEQVPSIGVQDIGVQNPEPLHSEPSPVSSLTPNKINKYQKIIPRSVGSIARGYKIGVTKWFRENTDIHAHWQRNFHEHIIRNAEEFDRIAQYIRINPFRWKEDKFYKE